MRSSEEDLLSVYLEKLVSGLGQFETDSREASLGLGLGGISLSRGEAHVLRWIVQSKRTLKAVEIGTLTGLSGLYILDGLEEGGKLWTLEKSEPHASAAEPILKSFAAEKNKEIELVVGDARQTLKDIEAQGPFDFIFIDGNKAAYGDYLAWAEINLKVGALLVADNVLLSSAVYKKMDSKFSPKQIEVMQKFNERLMDSSIWRGALLPTTEGLFIAEKLK